MIIKKIHIQKFRGFSDIDFQLWAHITAISGQNGTQKTTILGIISQWFAITDENNPMYWKRPHYVEEILCLRFQKSSNYLQNLIKNDSMNGLISFVIIWLSHLQCRVLSEIEELESCVSGKKETEASDHDICNIQLFT